MRKSAAFVLAVLLAGAAVLRAADYVTVGDYDGDGRSDPVVITEDSFGFNWHIAQSTFSYNQTEATSWGLGTDVPVTGDFDGDGVADVAVYRPSTRQIYALRSSQNRASYLTISIIIP